VKICFVDNTNFQYDSESINSEKLRGAETVLINITKELNLLGNEITVINNCSTSRMIENINWVNINTIKSVDYFDAVIANGDCNLFKYAISNNNILFSHSLQSLEKFIRKKQLLSYLKYKPKVCFLSQYHKKNRSKFLYFFGHINLRWAVDDIFLKTEVTNEIKKNQAIFISRPDRNLTLLLDIWKNNIFKKNDKLKLLATENSYNFQDNSIIPRKLDNRIKLINDLKSSRVCLIPGHKAELYCLVAEEAKELCVPIVTLGIGCLKERVEHGKTGYIANNKDEFAHYTLELFKNDDVWNSMRNNLIKQRGMKTWSLTAKNLLNQI
tara:strand:+ start:1281 stop:2255 length:975 start_codon:yes stop_codon:yes gene_type:complete